MKDKIMRPKATVGGLGDEKRPKATVGGLGDEKRPISWLLLIYLIVIFSIIMGWRLPTTERCFVCYNSTSSMDSVTSSVDAVEGCSEIRHNYSYYILALLGSLFLPLWTSGVIMSLEPYPGNITTKKDIVILMGNIFLMIPLSPAGYLFIKTYEVWPCESVVYSTGNSLVGIGLCSMLLLGIAFSFSHFFCKKEVGYETNDINV
jgi:hypothetical protein